MANNRVERKLINGKLCDVYYDKNGKAYLFHWVGVGRLKWGIPNPPVPKIENISNQCR